MLHVAAQCCLLLLGLTYAVWARAQTSVYKKYSGPHPPTSFDNLWVNIDPPMYYVTSRQAPGVVWVDQATSRAIYAFNRRHTRGYPHQDYLDHGDLVDSYKLQFEAKSLNKACIGTKGKGGNYYPQEDDVAEICNFVFAGACMHA